MSPEERSYLENTYALAKENNELLHSLQRRARIGTAMKVFYWAVIILMSFGAYYFIQPYMNMLLGLTDQIGGNSDTVRNLSQNFGDLLR
ncbi:MAG TPA: hypothetical protein VI775_01530 [Candidatus Paceibacterota bacterium]